MLNTFRSHHKKIMWILAIAVIPAFVLWGGISFLKEKNQNSVAKVGGRTITLNDMRYYVTMVQLSLALSGAPEKEKNISKQDIIQTAFDYILLLWKADKDRIKVSDSEVIASIKQMKFFSRDKTFDQQQYKHLLRQMHMEPQVFEEYIRNLLKIEKLYQKYIHINPSETDVKKLYRKDTQKARISYIFIPYDKLKEGIKVPENELEKFYQKNKSLFKEGPKIKIKYAMIPATDKEKVALIKNDLNNLKSIDDLKTKFSTDIKETTFIGKNDPIEGLGWQPAINSIAFSLKPKKISPMLETSAGYIFLQKEEEKAAFTPEFTEIKPKVEEAAKDSLAKEKAKVLADKLAAKIKNEKIENLKKLAEQENYEFKETGEFKYYDYIEGLGLNESVSKIIFSLKKGQIYPYPVFLSKGAYIIQLKDISSIDEADFTAKKEEYLARLKQSMDVMQKMKFLSQIRKESNARF
ncbi:MAG: SurA N-terminal domain-containing protein [Candidatus Omnitrophica bacterium]|nr:SurA N-terminal domain-containing protein [Candidatus Omnitrophota bacterium]